MTRTPQPQKIRMQRISFAFATLSMLLFLLPCCLLFACCLGLSASMRLVGHCHSRVFATCLLLDHCVSDRLGGSCSIAWPWFWKTTVQKSIQCVIACLFVCLIDYSIFNIIINILRKYNYAESTCLIRICVYLVETTCLLVHRGTAGYAECGEQCCSPSVWLFIGVIIACIIVLAIFKRTS